MAASRTHISTDASRMMSITSTKECRESRPTRTAGASKERAAAMAPPTRNWRCSHPGSGVGQKRGARGSCDTSGADWRMSPGRLIADPPAGVYIHPIAENRALTVRFGMEYRAVEESLMIDPGRRSGTSRRGVLVGAVMVAVVLTTRFAWSAIFTVDTTVDAHDATPGDGVCETTTGGGACSLRAAVEEANALAGHDQIDVPAGTYLFTVPYFGGPDTPPLMLSDDVDVIGAGAASTVVDGNCGFYGANGGVFRVRTPATASISGVTVRGGCESGCAGIYNDGTLSLRDAVLTDDVGQVGSITGGGGGLCNMGTATVVRTTVTNCTAGYGGGISNSGTLTLRESTVNGNAAETGGGIENTGDLTIVNSTIADNVAYGHYMRGGAFIGGWGGGILADGGTVRVTNSTVSHNSIDCGPEGCDGSGCSTTGVI